MASETTVLTAEEEVTVVLNSDANNKTSNDEPEGAPSPAPHADFFSGTYVPAYDVITWIRQGSLEIYYRVEPLAMPENVTMHNSHNGQGDECKQVEINHHVKEVQNSTLQLKQDEMIVALSRNNSAYKPKVFYANNPFQNKSDFLTILSNGIHKQLWDVRKAFLIIEDARMDILQSECVANSNLLASLTTNHYKSLCPNEIKATLSCKEAKFLNLLAVGEATANENSKHSLIISLNTNGIISQRFTFTTNRAISLSKASYKANFMALCNLKTFNAFKEKFANLGDLSAFNGKYFPAERYTDYVNLEVVRVVESEIKDSGDQRIEHVIVVGPYAKYANAMVLESYFEIPTTVYSDSLLLFDKIYRFHNHEVAVSNFKNRA